MLNFIVLVEVLIGYFRNSILANVRVLQTEKHTGSTCVCVLFYGKNTRKCKRNQRLEYIGIAT